MLNKNMMSNELIIETKQFFFLSLFNFSFQNFNDKAKY